MFVVLGILCYPLTVSLASLTVVLGICLGLGLGVIALGLGILFIPFTGPAFTYMKCVKNSTFSEYFVYIFLVIPRDISDLFMQCGWYLVSFAIH